MAPEREIGVKKSTPALHYFYLNPRHIIYSVTPLVFSLQKLFWAIFFALAL